MYPGPPACPSHTHTLQEESALLGYSLCLGQCLLTGQDVDVSVLVLVVGVVGMLCSDVHVSRTALHFLGRKIIHMENLSVQKTLSFLSFCNSSWKPCSKYQNFNCWVKHRVFQYCPVCCDFTLSHVSCPWSRSSPQAWGQMSTLRTSCPL